ncbi:MAG: DedA family protein [Nitrososphaeria archaeon]
MITIAVIAIAIILSDTLEDTLTGGVPSIGPPLIQILDAIVMFTRNVTAVVSSWSYVGIFLLMALESSSLPIPSEVVLPFSGYLVSQGQLNLLLTILVSTIGGIAGSSIDYYIGMKGMNLLSQQKALRHLLSQSNLEMADKWFKKFGASAVFLNRLIPGFRTVISFPAGAVKMSLSKFIVYTTAGCLVWDILLIYLGVYVGANWLEIASIWHYLIIGALIAVLGAFVLFLVRRRRRIQSEAS